MSNVLIGIIGVILFIGLALAGALFLGPRFQEATLNSKAAAIAQSNAQIANAAGLYRVQEGMDWASTNPVGLAPSYLKSVPPVTTSRQYTYGFRALDGNLAVSSTVLPGYSSTGWPTDDAEGRSLCAAIARQSGQTVNADGTPPDSTSPQGSTGCVRIIGSGWGNIQGLYVAYTRI